MSTIGDTVEVSTPAGVGGGNEVVRSRRQGRINLALSPAGAEAPLPDIWNRLNMLSLVRWDEPGAIREVQLTYPVCPVRLVEEFEGCNP